MTDADDPVLVPPEVADELEPLRDAGDLDPTDRAAAKEAASERGFEEAANWLERVGENVYERAARGEFVAGGDR